jgi:hypothetical protein
MLAVGCDVRTVVLDARSGRELLTVPGHHNERGQVAFSPDGRYLASVGDGWGDNRQTMQVFEVLTGKEVRPFDRGDPVFAVAFSPDGRWLATGGADTTALVWDLHNLAGAKFADTLSEEALAGRWAALADLDPAKAYSARTAMLHAPASATKFLAQRLKPAVGPGIDTVKRLIAGLDDPTFQKREAAQKELTGLAEAAALSEAVVKDAHDKAASEEARRRLAGLLEQIRPIPRPDPDLLRTLRCIEILEYAGTREAREVLRRLAGGDPHAYATREAARTLDQPGHGKE